MVIDAQAVSKRFLLRHDQSAELKVRFLNLLRPGPQASIEEFWAVRNVSLSIERGEAVGLVGRNGSGKSTFLKLVAGIHRPTSGRVLVARQARICSLIELGVGFHPELTGRENVFLSSSIHGMSREEIEALYPAIVNYSGLEHFMDVPIKNYSSGMHMRLGFAVSANLDPDILLLDEVFAVGDADFQLRCIATVRRFVEQGRTIMFVSHAPDNIRSICRRVCVLEHGQLTFDGELEAGLAFYHGTFGQPPAVEAVPPVAAPPIHPDATAHRVAAGDRWSEAGAWQFDFLRAHGLRPQHRVLEVGCGSLSAAIHLLPFLDDGCYWGLESNHALLDAGMLIELPAAGVSATRGHFLVNDTFSLDQTPGAFDVAFANSLFAHLPLNGIARCVAGVVRHLRPAGAFYATWFENPDPQSFEPIHQPSGITTWPDREPYHYSFAVLDGLCDTLGVAVERVPTPPHPRGESVLAFTRRI